ncbi:hypothetical protein [Piscinibacter sp. HJYY11]|uniref:hypothetical protein n=1 Tax=Piscinibacter sp. HJYY11 TaxID=2801333 RepID=UPI00191D2B98|nr:hypothetical protein [Piscinibacter sp. HJYY11]MBL0727928.1 hypothetical protein [Piscinibacter sp. HJYY11]
MFGLQYLRDHLRFQGTAAERRQLVVYSEGGASWPHLGPVVEGLLARADLPFAYVSSMRDDPGVTLRHPSLTSYVIGDRKVRTLFFQSLQAEVVLMTMPDLQTFHIKRSPRVRRYVYLHHSLVSSHMAYRDGAFDHFDAVLCAGPHHVAELRAIEALKGVPAKELVPHGYGRLDTIRAAAGTDLRSPERPLVVVAPSWGPQGLLEQHADRLMEVLSILDWDVVVRPHPQTMALAPAAIDCVRRWCASHPHLSLEANVVGNESLRRAHVMVSDWSGAAFDFALGLDRPVLFVDVPRKVNNPGYAAVGIEPIEVFGRASLGEVLAAANLAELPRRLAALVEKREAYEEAIRRFRERWLFNVGTSADAAVRYLVASLEAAGS